MAEETGVPGCRICAMYGTILHGVLVYGFIYTRYRFRLPCTFILQNIIVYCKCLTTISVNIKELSNVLTYAMDEIDIDFCIQMLKQLINFIL